MKNEYQVFVKEKNAKANRLPQGKYSPSTI
jgi:hypothetical protein